ncbi:hypothetical protein ES703_61297 [subsurface metagenome]
MKAHQLAGETEILVEVIKTKSEKELKKLAYQWNSNHGLQLNNDEKKRYANEMIEEVTIKELALILSVSEESIAKWTVLQRKALEDERNRKIMEMYLHAWNTQQDIADVFGLSQDTIKNVINNENSKFTKIVNFQPFIYNIWNVQKGNETSHFGSFPKVFMDNFLYYHTKPLDIIFDPFVGDGTTIDSCKEFYRRYYCSDIEVKPGREKDILQHDITKGLPDNLPKPKIAFLDPPYWKQSENKYSDIKTDLGNMNLKDFNNAISNLLNELKNRKVEKIAIVIQPTQFSNQFNLIDHIFDFHGILNDKYKIKMRYILPYSTQQYNAQIVNKAKELKECLILNRDLIIWELK